MDSDASEDDKDGRGNNTDSINESHEWALTQETDSFVKLVFRKLLTKR